MKLKVVLTLLSVNAFAAFITYGMTQFGGDLVSAGASWIGGVMILALAIPTMWSWWKWQKWRAVVIMTVLGGYALVFESIAVVTGIPYGHFSYIDAFGSKVLGLVPWTVAFAWMPIALGAWILAHHFWPTAKVARVVMTACLLVLYDLVLDPGAVALGYWVWSESGRYYGVPMSNFFGWFISGIGGAVLIEIFSQPYTSRTTAKPGLSTALLLSLILWTWVCGWLGLLIPFVGGLLMIGGLGWLNFRWQQPSRP